MHQLSTVLHAYLTNSLILTPYHDICFEIEFEQCRDLSACVHCNNTIRDDRPLSWKESSKDSSNNSCI